MNLFQSKTSEEIDRHYGLLINEIENDLLLKARSLRPQGNMASFGEVLHGGHQTWVGLDPQTLNTPYAELDLACELLKPVAGELFVDLGAGYGRLGLVLSEKCPGVKFLGYELVKERVDEGNRIFGEQKLMTQDLMSESFELPVAEYYFLYDFGKTEHIRRIMRKLEKLADSHHFKVVARGKGSRSIIEFEHPWLTCLSVLHEENFSIYSY